MFVVGVSYMSLLQSVATRCLLPYVSTVCEISDDKTAGKKNFWAYAQPDAISGYEKAALQAVRYLQSIYGFIVADYSFEGMVVYRKFVEAITTATPAQMPADFFIQGNRMPRSLPHAFELSPLARHFSARNKSM
ncbi:hypothetical protein PVAP13_9KG237826 [Panicum virgatum]|uniref:Uncharacterized protein n=1 Tax=Panicum virgatum TaxID=38727 RepID=A0A8T0NL28_PANVG|nr:hypothetical protein PVAP13_9KG237826 [Panicum virgatum]